MTVLYSLFFFFSSHGHFGTGYIMSYYQHVEDFLPLITRLEDRGTYPKVFDPPPLFLFFFSFNNNKRYFKHTHSYLCSLHLRPKIYVQDADAIEKAFSELRETIGPLPFTAAAQTAANGAEAADGTAAAATAGGDGGGGGSTTITKNVVLSDGTYATQTTVVGTY